MATSSSPLAVEVTSRWIQNGDQINLIWIYLSRYSLLCKREMSEKLPTDVAHWRYYYNISSSPDKIYFGRAHYTKSSSYTNSTPMADVEESVCRSCSSSIHPCWYFGCMLIHLYFVVHNSYYICRAEWGCVIYRGCSLPIGIIIISPPSHLYIGKSSN